MAKELTDDELNLRRKTRRRLIGAFALTLAVVVILPMVLDNEPKPSGNNIDLTIPSPDKAGEFVPGTAITEITASAPSAASTVVTTPVPIANPVIVSPAQKPAEIQKPVETRKSAETRKPTETKSADKPATDEAYVAQVGAYANSSAARQELAKLKKLGFKAFTEKAGDKIRVRVGPYSDREKAEKVGKLLEKHGLHPVILSAK